MTVGLDLRWRAIVLSSVYGIEIATVCMQMVEIRFEFITESADKTCS
jgi:hypothetical protein